MGRLYTFCVPARALLPVALLIALASNGWALEQKLTDSDGENGDGLGRAVSLSGDTIVVSASGDDGNTGSATVFTRSGLTWTEQQKLTASDAAPGHQFGYSAALDDDTIVIGAFGNEAAYVFIRSGNTWTEQQKLTASDGASGDSFGSSVAIQGDTLVV